MPFFYTILGKTGQQAEVDANYQLNVVTNSDPTKVGFVKLADKYSNQLVSLKGGQQTVSMDDLLFSDPTEGAAINTNLWAQSALNMTITVANGFINLNPTNVVTASSYANLISIQSFGIIPGQPLRIHGHIQSSLMNLPANTTIECGWGSVATNAIPTDGVFFRVRDGAMYAVQSFGGVENSTTLSPSPYPLPNTNQSYEVYMDIYSDKADFIIDGTKFATIAMPGVNPSLTSSSRQPIFLRVYNGGTAPASSPTFRFGQCSVSTLNTSPNRNYDEIATGFGRGSYQSPSAFTKTANWTNITACALATLSNTAASYTTLGGAFLCTLPAGAATAEYPIFGYQVPAGWQLIVQSVVVSAGLPLVHTATASMVQWFLGVNSSGVSLATVDGAGTWGPRIIPIGTQTIPASAAAGTAVVNSHISMMGVCLGVVDSTRWCQIIMRVPNGAAGTASGFAGTVFIGGYFR